MRHKGLRAWLGAVLLACALPASAAFVTDRVTVPLRAEPDPSSPVLKTLSSGEQVEILLRAGQNARVRTRDGQIGWLPDALLSEERPLSLEYLDLRSRYKALEQKLAAAEARLAAPPPAAEPAGEVIDAQALASLRQQAKDGRWMKVEMEKARARAKQLQAELDALRKKSATQTEALSSDQQALQAELATLRAENADLQTRLAAALLLAEEEAAPVAAPASSGDAGAATVEVTWPMFLGGLLAALLAGGLLGMRWLDRRIRARHGGFRLY